MSHNQSEAPTILDVAPLDFYKEGQAVQLVIKAETDLGYKAIVDGKYWGVLYYSDVFQPLDRNEEIKGYIKKVRSDGKIDLSLHQTGNSDADAIGERIMNQLQKTNGYLEISDKASPELIYELFSVSKKKFKIALGGLYKKHLIEIKPDGIYLVNKK